MVFELVDGPLSQQLVAAEKEGTSPLQYLILPDSTVKLPVLGYVKLAGLTVREAEQKLEEEYNQFYKNPFVMLELKNRRVIVYTGARGGSFTQTASNNASGSRVVYLQNESTTLIEVLAQAGGISGTGKAYKVKLVRGELRDPQVFRVDLSTIEGIRAANLYVEPGDIVYVEPTWGVSAQLIETATLALSTITTAVLLITLIEANQN